MSRKKFNKQKIVEGIVEGTIKVYEDLDAQLLPKVITYVCKNSGTRQDAEDLFRDVVFLIYKIFREGYEFDTEDKGTFEGFFMTILKRRWIDHLRKQKRDVTVHAIDIDDVNESNTMEIFTVNYADIEIVKIVRRYRERLSEYEQELLRKRYEEGLKPSEIVDKYYPNVKVGTIRTRLSRIRDKLRGWMLADSEFTSLFFIQ